MQCDICGIEKNLLKCVIEGTQMNTCKECSVFGTTLKVIKPTVKKEIPKEDPFVIKGDSSQLIKKKREILNMKQEELALKINEKISLIQKVESDKFPLSLRLASKLEKVLSIVLVEKRDIKNESFSSSNDSSMTIGDAITIKKTKRL